MVNSEERGVPGALLFSRERTLHQPCPQATSSGLNYPTNAHKRYLSHATGELPHIELALLPCRGGATTIQSR